MRTATWRAATAVAWSWMALVVWLPASAVAAEPAWVPLGGPTGGDVRALAVDPRRPQTVFLGTADGVLYRSDDGGRRWQRLVPGFPERGMSLDDIVIDPRGRVLVGYWEVSGDGGGVARSSDGGTTFEILPLERRQVRALAVAPSSPDVIVAGTLAGVFRSDDGGDTWRRISPAGDPELRNVNSIAIDPLDPDVIYAGTWHLPWKTVDGGARWRSIHAGMIDDSDVMTLNVDRRSGSAVYASACSGIYRSTDGAARWAKVRGIPSSSRRTRAFAQDPERPDTFYAGTTEGLWRSRDGLASWSLVSEKNLVVNALALLPDGVVLAGTDGAGVRRSQDGGDTWTPSNQGFAEHFVSEVLFDRGGRVVVSLRGDRFHSGVLEAPSLGGPWKRLQPGLEGREVVSLALVPGSADPSGVPAGRGPSGVLAGTDAGVFQFAVGVGWRRLATEIGGIDEHPRVAALAALDARSLLAGTPQGLLRSTDGGASWSRRDLGLARSVTALGVSPDAAGRVAAATPLGVFESLDGGATWEARGISPAPVPFTRLAYVPGRDGALVATSARGLYVSQDGGRSWLRRGGGLPHGHITGLALHADGRTLVASDFTNGGLYRSADGGLTWTALTSAGLLSERVYALALDPRDGGGLVAAPPTGGLHLLVSGAGAGPTPAAGAE